MSPRRAALPSLLLVALVAGGVLLYRSRADVAPPAVATPQAGPAGGPAPEANRRADPEPAAASAAADEPTLPPGFEPDDPAVAWAEVDLDEVREALPDNLYWSTHVPTHDAAILAEREREATRWRELRTRVESANASEAEVDEYFAHRRRVHGDAVEFTTYLIDHYGDVLPERDLAMLHVARRLNQARLFELPRRHAEAQERRVRQEEARRLWREQQAALEAAEAPDAGNNP